MRLKHYVKNLIVFIPLFFNKSLFNKEMFLMTLFGFIAFSLLCSGVYTWNDISDLESDRQHPLKKKRPLASGKISLKYGYALAIGCFSLPFVIAYFANFNSYAAFWMIGYVILNLLYSSKLKQIPIIDIITLSAFYLIRLYFGASLCGIEVSTWLFLTIMFGSLMLGSGKRYKERTNFTKQNLSMTREVLRLYTSEFLHDCVLMSAILTVVFYSLWTLVGVFLGTMTTLVIYTIPMLAIFVLSYIYELSNDSSEDVVMLLIGMPTTPIIIISVAVIFIVELYIRGPVALWV